MTRHHLATSALFALALTLLPANLLAQDKSDKPQDPPPAEHKSSIKPDPSIIDCIKQPTRPQMLDCAEQHAQVKTIFLENVDTANQANEILVAVRNLFDPSMKIYMTQSQNAITIRTYPEEIARVEAYVRILDRPHKTYRITFTIAESDSGKRIGVQHFSLIAVAGERTTLKQGSKIPVATGKYDDGKNGTEQQFTYLDVGMNFDVTPDQRADGLHLKAKVEQSSAAESTEIAGVREPVIRQSVLEGTSTVTIGKPLTLGQIDVPGTTRHLDIEVVAEPIN